MLSVRQFGRCVFAGICILVSGYYLCCLILGLMVGLGYGHMGAAVGLLMFQAIGWSLFIGVYGETKTTATQK